ncbi:hypothetical protein ABPG74_000782 [Tetrahymena malaccensis]
MNLKIFLLIFSILFDILKCADCPLLQTYDRPSIEHNYVVLNFLRIPKTNVLVINSWQTQDKQSSIVYYNDMSSSSGEIINVIKPEYLIVDMLFNVQTDQIIIFNFDVLIFADPYTLNPLNSFSIPYICAIKLINGTNYIILTNCFSQLQIFDFENQKVVLLMDNSYQIPSSLGQYYSDIYKLKNGQNVILTTNDIGVIAWGIDLTKLTYDFYGYIQDTQVNNKGDLIRSFTKHPTEDIIFVTGQNMQLIAIQIKDIQLRQFKTLLNVKIRSDGYYIQSIQFVREYNNGQYYPCLWMGSGNYIYEIYLNIRDDLSTISIQQSYKYRLKNFYRWYTIEEESIFIISGITYVQLLNYKTGEVINNLFLLFDKGSFGFCDYDAQKPQLSGNVAQNYGSFYQVKNTFDWYFMKSVDDYQNSLIFTFPIYPLNQAEQVIIQINKCIFLKYSNYYYYFQITNITGVYGLNWADINQNLDPFYLNGRILVTLAFPNKSKNLNYLFLLLNSQSTTETYYLTSLQSDVTSIQTAYAIPSLEDPSNLEFIGIDNAGTIYSWDLSQQNLPFKYSINFSMCQNSKIGQVFQYQNVKKLVMSCSDNNVYSFDLATGDYQFICKLNTQPLALRAFSNSSLIAIGDLNSGIAKIFKFNSKTFDFFLQLQSTKVQDKLIYIEMLNEQTIWVQYIDSNLFYSIKECLSDSSLCTQCTQQYYFTATNDYDSNGVYGMGTSDNPFTTSNNFLTAMIKAQYYKQIVNGVSNMNVEIFIQPDQVLNLNPNLMNFDFNSIISLNFQSTKPGTYSSLEHMGALTLQNYNQVNFQDIIIQFLPSQNTNSCGLILSKIQSGIILNNIQLLVKQKTSTSLSCQSIYVDSSQLLVQQYNITNEDFTNHESIITTFNSTQIVVQNFSLSNSTLGENFSIFQQQSNIQLILSNLTIRGNVCSQDSDQDDEVISALFSAGLFTVQNMTMEDNSFCKKSIFSIVSSQKQSQLVFLFSNISVVNNLFQTRTTYLFFDAFYPMRATPSHELDLNQITFFNNTSIQSSIKDMNTTSFFQTSKIANISITNSEINNHHNIQFGSFENVGTINITGFKCQNDDTYFDNISIQQTIGCLQLNEVYQSILTQIQVLKKISMDSTLISLQNSHIQESIFSITNSTFIDLVFYQNNLNTAAIPLYVISNYQIDMEIDACIFNNITLKTFEYYSYLCESTTALWVANNYGSVHIKNSYFLNSYSFSIYGYIYIQTDSLIIDTVQFNNSTYTTDEDYDNFFTSYGGMVNAKASDITIINSNFTQATAFKGSFLYLVSSVLTFYVNLTNILFCEGYALLDGGAIFIDTNSYNLQFNCNNCQFKNIYTSSFDQLSSTIGIEQYAKSKSDDQSLIAFNGGYIENTFGVNENYFINVNNTELQFLNISSIYSEYDQDQDTQFVEQAILANLQNSDLLMQNCNISNISLSYSTLPLLINSLNSSITLKNMIIQELNFSNSVINLIQSQIQISNVQFININQGQFSNRLIQQDYQEQSEPPNSLIVSKQSIININKNTIFSKINCNKNCNGGVLQVNSGVLFIDSTQFSQIQSTFGGALFIYGINKTNQISNSQFLNCSSSNDGGALYIYSLEKDEFNLTVVNSVFSQNQCNSRGGAIYINSEVLNSVKQKITLKNSQIKYNQADIGGGIFNQNLPITKYNNQVSNNSAKTYGNNELSYASQLLISNIDSFLTINDGLYDKSQIVINNFRSGSNLSDIQFVFLNNKNERIFPITDDEYQNFAVNASFDPNTKNIQAYSISGDTTAKYNKQLQSFIFNNITLVGTPGSSAKIEFTSKQIYTLNEQTQTFSAIQSMVATLSQKIDYFKRFIKEEKPKKQIKPEIKEKYQILFKKILSLKPKEKKKLFLQIMEQQLVQFHGHLFSEDNQDEEQNSIQIQQELNTKICLDDNKEKLENIIQLQNIQKESSIISSTPYYQDMDINQPKISKVRPMELIKLENQFTNQEEGKEEIQNLKQNFQFSQRFTQMFEQQLNSSNYGEGSNKYLQHEFIDEKQINIELNQYSKNQEDE